MGKKIRTNQMFEDIKALWRIPDYGSAGKHYVEEWMCECRCGQRQVYTAAYLLKKCPHRCRRLAKGKQLGFDIY